MKFFYPVIFLTLIPFFGFGQIKKNTYIQFEIAMLLRGNPNQGETFENGTRNTDWFLPDGLSSKMGFGIHKNKSFLLGIHSGIEWMANKKINSHSHLREFKNQSKSEQ